jgi:pimeloyl-ACP methyl ester carboxylesterase
MDVLFEDDLLKVTFEPGSSGLAVISFTGISFGSIGVGEFKSTLTRSGLDNDIYYVFDKQRKWYNGPHAETLVTVLNDAIASRGNEAVFTLGNSMGGTGALAFAGEIERCVRAVSFCAQTSINPGIAPFEVRWADYRRGIDQWTMPDALPRVSRDREYYVFYGADNALDMQHAARVVALNGSNIHVFVVPECGHDVARKLKKLGFLRPVTKMLMRPIAPSLDELLATMPGVGLLRT